MLDGFEEWTEFEALGLLFTFAQIIILVAGWVKNVKIEKLLIWIGCSFVLIGITTMIGIGEGILLLTIITSIPFFFLVFLRLIKPRYRGLLVSFRHSRI